MQQFIDFKEKQWNFIKFTKESLKTCHEIFKIFESVSVKVAREWIWRALDKDKKSQKLTKSIKEEPKSTWYSNTSNLLKIK